MELKMKDREFLDDTVSLLRIEEKYNYIEAYELIKKEIIEKILSLSK